MENGKERQQLILLASSYHQQAQEVEEKISFVSSQVQELKDFSSNLDFLINSKKNEILSSLGKGVYMETEIKSKSLFVQVGSGVVVKKTPEETRNVIESQIHRLKEAQTILEAQFSEIQNSLNSVIGKIEAQNNNHNR